MVILNKTGFLSFWFHTSVHKGQQLSFKRLTDGERGQVEKWLLDVEIARLTFVIAGPHQSLNQLFIPDRVKQYLDALIHDPRRLSYGIWLNDEHIGNIGLKEYEPKQTQGELFIEIGERRHQGKGLGTGAMVTFLNHLFETLGMKKVTLEVLEFNTAAVQLYEKLGFMMMPSNLWHYDANSQAYFRVLKMSLMKERWDYMKKRVKLRPNLTLKNIER